MAIFRSLFMVEKFRPKIWAKLRFWAELLVKMTISDFCQKNEEFLHFWKMKKIFIYKWLKNQLRWFSTKKSEIFQSQIFVELSTKIWDFEKNLRFFWKFLIFRWPDCLPSFWAGLGEMGHYPRSMGYFIFGAILTPKMGQNDPFLGPYICKVVILAILGVKMGHFLDERFWRSSRKWAAPKMAKFDLLGKFWGHFGGFFWDFRNFWELLRWSNFRILGIWWIPARVWKGQNHQNPEKSGFWWISENFLKFQKILVATAILPRDW